MASRTFEKDFDGDGIADRRTRIEFRYDARGNEIGQVVEDDFDADGVIDSRRTTASDYDR